MLNGGAKSSSCACSAIALTIFGRAWPALTHHRPATPSSTSRPSGVQKCMPDALASRRGCCLNCRFAVNGIQNASMPDLGAGAASEAGDSVVGSSLRMSFPWVGLRESRQTPRWCHLARAMPRGRVVDAMVHALVTTRWSPRVPTMKPVLILQHLSLDGPAYLGSWLEREGRRFELFDSERGEAYPERIDAYGALAVL